MRAFPVLNDVHVIDVRNADIQMQLIDDLLDVWCSISTAGSLLRPRGTSHDPDSRDHSLNE